MTIDHNNTIPESEYFQTEHMKTQIVLHHTVSSKGIYVDDFWREDKGKIRVATAFVVDKDGTVFQVFDPKHWAYHIGKGSKDSHNQSSIGIEIVNEGPLKKMNSAYYWGDGFKNKFFGEVHVIPETWRGYEHFAKYPMIQTATVVELVDLLLKQFPTITRQVITSFDYDQGLLSFNGIVKHCDLRADKTDVSPAFPIQLFSDSILSLG